MKQKPQKLTPGKWPKFKSSEQRAKYFDRLVKKQEKVDRMSETRCGCRRCLRERDERVMGQPIEQMKMIVCASCGNKRCPHATDHRHVCTNSNETGQPGSWYA